MSFWKLAWIISEVWTVHVSPWPDVPTAFHCFCESTILSMRDIALFTVALQLRFCFATLHIWGRINTYFYGSAQCKAQRRCFESVINCRVSCEIFK